VFLKEICCRASFRSC